MTMKNFSNEFFEKSAVVGRSSVIQSSRRVLAIGVFALGFAAATPSWAQSQERIAPPSRSELAPPQPAPDEQESTSVTINGGLERAPCALDDARYADILINLNGVDFQGADEAPELSFNTAYSEYLGRELPIAVLCDIRSRVAQTLLSNGYLATVEIPEQELSDGNAQFRIVFGRLTAIRVRGDAGPSEGLVASYLQKLVGQEVFNSQEIERYLLLASDLPGLDVRLALRPDADGNPGDLIGEIAVVRQRGAVDFSVQNFGSKALGRFGGLIRGEVYDLTGLGDRTYLSVFSTADVSEQQTVQVGHDFRIGSEGLTFGGQLTYSATNPDLDLPGFAVESETVFGTINASYPLVRSRAKSIYAAGGFDFANQNVEVNEIDLTRDRVRMLFARLAFTQTDEDSFNRLSGYTPFEPRSRFSGSIEIRRGLGVLGSSPDCRADLLACLAGGAVPPSRIEADPTPTVVRLNLAGEYRPVPNIAFFLTADGQVSGDALPSFEEFAGGNYSVGRGYDPGSILGDSGLGIGAEMRVGTLAPSSMQSFAWQPFLFTDAAWAWNEDPSRSPLNPDRLWSAGGGVRFAYGGSVQGDVTVAVPLEETDFQARRGDVRVLFSLTTRLFPWRF